MVRRFEMTECLPGREGVVLVGTRGPGTRVARKLHHGRWLEIELPFEPTKSLPVAWRPDGSLLIVGKHNKALSVDRNGKTTPLTLDATLLAGVVSAGAVIIAYGMGPEFFIEQPGRSFARESGNAIKMKLMTTVAIGTQITIAVERNGVLWKRGQPGDWWRPLSFPGPKPQFYCAAVQGEAIFIGGTGGTLLRCDSKGVKGIHLSGLEDQTIYSLAATRGMLFAVTDSGLLAIGKNGVRQVKLPSSGSVSHVSALDDQIYCVQEGRVLTSQRGVKWTMFKGPS
jgi:hypothetical protein